MLKAPSMWHTDRFGAACKDKEVASAEWFQRSVASVRRPKATRLEAIVAKHHALMYTGLDASEHVPRRAGDKFSLEIRAKLEGEPLASDLWQDRRHHHLLYGVGHKFLVNLATVFGFVRR